MEMHLLSMSFFVKKRLKYEQQWYKKRASGIETLYSIEQSAFNADRCNDELLRELSASAEDQAHDAS